MDAVIFGFLSIGGTTLLAVLGMLLVRKYVPLQSLKGYHEVAGYLLSVIGTLYAVLLGFVVVDAMTTLQETRMMVTQEANSVSNLFQLSDGLPALEKQEIRKLCIKYCEVVINDEWPAMQEGKYSNEAFGIEYQIWKTVANYKPTANGDTNVHDEMLDQISKVGDNRRARLVASKHGVSGMLWCVLIIGGIFTILFTYFFGVENLKAQVVMTILVASTLSLNVYLVYCYGYPYSGDISVGSEAFQLDRMIFEGFSDDKFDKKDVENLPF